MSGFAVRSSILAADDSRYLDPNVATIGCSCLLAYASIQASADHIRKQSFESRDLFMCNYIIFSARRFKRGAIEYSDSALERK